MDRISTVAELKSAIRVLEIEQNAKELLLREQAYLAYESLKPINIIRRTIQEVFSTSFLRENITGTAVGAAGGYLLKKLLVGRSGGILKKILGTLLQLGITNVASNKSDVIKSIGHTLIDRIFHKKEKVAEEPDI